MTLRVAVVMDPIDGLKPEKDTTLALMAAAEQRGHELFALGMNDLSMRGGLATGRARPVTVAPDERPFYRWLGPAESGPLSRFDCLWMRKDPPFDLEYITATWILEHANADGCLVLNNPQSLRDCNEKFFTTWFPELCPPMLIGRDRDELSAFHREHGDIIVKPLDGMGGASIFRIRKDDGNLDVILETLTEHGRRYCVAQRYIPEIRDGDKRILMVDGKPASHCLARIPAAGRVRGNLAAGGRGEVRPLSVSDRAIAETVGPVLAELGLVFVGLDVIGDRLTEINVTSPTCVREIEAGSDARIADAYIDAMESRVAGGPEPSPPVP